MKLSDRINAEETKIGKILKNYFGKGLLLIGSIGELTNMLGMIPADLQIPSWVRVGIFVCSGISFVSGSLTAKLKQDSDKPKA